MEFTARQLDAPSPAIGRDLTWRENSGHAYLFKTSTLDSSSGPLSGWQASMSAELEYEKVERPQDLTGSEGIMDLETIMAPIGVQFFSRKGTTLRLATTYVAQNGVFSIGSGSPIVETEDDGWITDLTLEYRLTGAQGVVAVGVRNLFDESIDLLEIDPVNPRVATQQFVFAKFSLEF